MNGRQLDRRVTIERATMIDDGFGQVESWAPLVTTWASKRDVSDAERIRAGSVSAEITTRFRLRWRSVIATVTPKDRLVHEGRVYNIFSVKEIGRREGVEITGAARAE
ncbi:phage head closure protein [Pseudooceanicola nanhaiensis]|uniref:phage head closure protein n=1 Tax=Pseudooceanicola nanhaiensis TaxID=375761 RepID=UPI0035133058